MKRKHILRKIFIIAAWLIIWQIIYIKVESDFLIAGPADTVQVLFSMLVSCDFYRVIGFSLIRILTGFFAAFILGFTLAVFSYKSELISDFLKPFFTFLKAVPVASFVILALMITGSRNLSVFIALMIALPVIYSNILTAVLNTDKKLLRLAEVFRFSLHSRICAVFIPQLYPFIASAGKLSIGMCFKAGVAAEVIACSAGSIGERLYMSKIYFQTGELFAWTIVIIVLSYVCEQLYGILASGICRIISSDSVSLGHFRIREVDRSAISISALDISKAYGEKAVIDGISFDISSGIIAVTGESGNGKTTLLDIILKAVYPDKGQIRVKGSLSVVFQDQRLIEGCRADTNVLYSVFNNNTHFRSEREAKKEIKEVLSGVLPEECLLKPVNKLSGGERRRVEIVRALLSPARICILDEPFSGLDDENRIRMLKLIKEHSDDRIIIIAVHDINSLEGLEVKKEIKV